MISNLYIGNGWKSPNIHFKQVVWGSRQLYYNHPLEGFLWTVHQDFMVTMSRQDSIKVAKTRWFNVTFLMSQLDGHLTFKTAYKSPSRKKGHLTLNYQQKLKHFGSTDQVVFSSFWIRCNSGRRRKSQKRGGLLRRGLIHMWSYRYLLGVEGVGHGLAHHFVSQRCLFGCSAWLLRLFRGLTPAFYGDSAVNNHQSLTDWLNFRPFCLRNHPFFAWQWCSVFVPTKWWAKKP